MTRSAHFRASRVRGSPHPVGALVAGIVGVCLVVLGLMLRVSPDRWAVVIPLSLGLSAVASVLAGAPPVTIALVAGAVLGTTAFLVFWAKPKLQ